MYRVKISLTVFVEGTNNEQRAIEAAASYIDGISDFHDRLSSELDFDVDWSWPAIGEDFSHTVCVENKHVDEEE